MARTFEGRGVKARDQADMGNGTNDWYRRRTPVWRGFSPSAARLRDERRRFSLECHSVVETWCFSQGIVVLGGDKRGEGRERQKRGVVGGRLTGKIGVLLRVIAPGGGQTVKNGTNEDTSGDEGGGGGGGDVDGGWRDDDSNVAWDLDKGNFPFSATRQPIASHNQ